MPIEKIEPSNRIKNENQTDLIFPKININQIRGTMKKTVLTYLNTLKKRAEMTNNRAKKQKLPFRLKVHTVGNDNVFLDVIIIDDK